MAKQAALAQQYEINIPERAFNTAFYPYIRSIYNYEVYWGGRGSGKSVNIAMKLVLQLSTTEGRNLVVMRKQATDCRNSCFAEIYKVIYKFNLQDMWQIRESPDMRMYNRITKCEIIFTGMDKAENVKSLTFKHGGATDLWYEEVTEELSEENIITLDNSIRSWNKKCRLILSFNPVIATFWLNGWLQAFLGYKQDDLSKPYVGKVPNTNLDCLIHHSTWRDNDWNYEWRNGQPDYRRPSDYGSKLERLIYSNPYKYRVDCLGEWGTAGESVFNANKISARMRTLAEIHKENPPITYNFSYDVDERGNVIIDTVHGAPSDAGEAVIFKEPDPRHPYVAALDTAGEGEDYYLLQIMDNFTDEQVARYRSLKGANECMIQVYGLLRMYNDALVAPEVNFSDYPVLKLKEWGYMNIYQREKPMDSLADGNEKKLGFRTTVGNRQSIIDNMIEWCDHNMDKIYDLTTLDEMLTFTKQNRKNKGIFMGAEAGAHDDTILAFAILLKAKEQQRCDILPEMQTINGYWTKGELQLALRDNRIDEDTMREYMDKHPKQFKKEMKGRSRYAR